MIDRFSWKSNAYYVDIKIRFFSTLLFFAVCIKDLVLLVMLHRNFPFMGYYNAWAGIFIFSGLVELLILHNYPKNFYTEHVSCFPLIWLVYGPNSFIERKINLGAIVQNLEFFFVLLVFINIVISAMNFMKSSLRTPVN